MDAVATAKLALDASSFDRGLQRAEASVSQFAKTAGTMIAGAFAFDKIISGFSMAIEKGDQLQDIAEKFGVSASKLQLLGNAASVFGSGIENVSTGLNKLSLAQQKAVTGEQGAEELVAIFKEVGIGFEELRSMSPEDIFLRIADSFASGANEGRQFVIVNTLLGKAQTDLIKVMNQGSAAILEQGNAIGVWSDETIAQLSMASDALKTFQNYLVIGFGFLISNVLLPIGKEIQIILDLLTQLGLAAFEFGSGNFAAAKEIFQGIDRSETRARYAMQTESPKKTTAKMLAEEASTEDVATSLSDKSISKPISMPSSMSIEVFNNIYNEVRAIKGGLFQMQDLLDKRLGVPILRSAS
jgi:hypothetical protein